MVDNVDIECRQLLANFFKRTKKNCAHWFPIILEKPDESSSSISGSYANKELGLNTLLGMNYEDIYIPFMKRCGLITNFKHNKTGAIMDVPNIHRGGFNKSGYTWEMFLVEFKLDFLEVAYICSRNGREKYYLKVGSFSNNQKYNILEQKKRTQRKLAKEDWLLVAVLLRKLLFHLLHLYCLR
jgi:hypothetical protein